MMTCLAFFSLYVYDLKQLVREAVPVHVGDWVYDYALAPSFALEPVGIIWTM